MSSIRWEQKAAHWLWTVKPASSWFSMMLEANLQEMANDDYFSMGIGLKPYCRWTLFRRWAVHPYIEYGAGIFYAFSKFPENGGNLTFNKYWNEKDKKFNHFWK